MALQRSPPATQRYLQATNSAMQYHSDPALNTEDRREFDDEDEFCNVSKRQKRSASGLKIQAKTPSSSIQALFDQLHEQQDRKFEMINDALLSIKAQNDQIQSTITALTAQQENFIDKINYLQQENTEYKKRLTYLENKVDFLEKNVRSSTIEIRNVPVQNQESKQGMLKIIQSLGHILNLGTQIQDNEIKDIYRSKSKAIIVDFTTTLRKENLITNYKSFNKLKREKKETQLNSEHLNLPGIITYIYISESLSSKTKRILYVARELVKNKTIAAAWTSYGKVFIRKEDGKPPLRIAEESDLSVFLK